LSKGSKDGAKEFLSVNYASQNSGVLGMEWPTELAQRVDTSWNAAMQENESESEAPKVSVKSVLVKPEPPAEVQEGETEIPQDF
jgi:hypothetical protein